MITRRGMLVTTSGFAVLALTGAAGGQPTTAATQGRIGAMLIRRTGSEPSRKGQAEYFTGGPHRSAVPGA